MQNHVQHIEDNAGNGRGLSAGVFRKFSLDQAAFGVCPGVFVFEDFIAPIATVTAAKHYGFNWSHAGVGTAVAGGQITVDPGTAAVMSVASDNLFSLDMDDPSVEAAVEFRLKCDSLTAPMAVGFSEDGTAAIDGSGLDASVNTIAIVRDSGDTTFKCAITNGTVETTVGVVSDAVAADEWVRLGVRIGLKADKKSVEVEFFFNGARLGIANLSVLAASLFVDMDDLEAFATTEGDHLNTLDYGAYYVNE